MISAAQIKRFAPSARADLVEAIVENWDQAEVVGGITTPLRIAHFMAQIATETGGLRAIEENMNYSAERLRKVFPTRVTAELAKRIAHNPEVIAGHVYGGRLGNRGAADGWRYRGGGMMQTTGRHNYRKIGFEDNPELLRQPETAFMTAVREWKNRGCNAPADRDDVAAVRKLINGGTNGLAECRRYLARAKGVFGVDASHRSEPSPVPRPEPTKPILIPIPSPPRKPVAMDAQTVRLLQVKLSELGYHTVGIADGIWGEWTRAALLAFKADNGLPLNEIVDTQVMAALMVAKPRVISPERQKADLDTVRDQAPKIPNANWWTKLIAQVFAFFGLAASTVSGIAENLGEATNYVTPVKSFLTSIPIWAWGLIIFVIAVACFIVSRRTDKVLVEDFRAGKVV